MALIAGGLLYSRRKQDIPVPEGNRIQLVSSQDDVSDFDAIVSHLQREKGGITLQEILAMGRPEAGVGESPPFPITPGEGGGHAGSSSQDSRDGRREAATSF